MARKPKIPKPTALFNRNETIGLCKRFVKIEQYDGRRDLMVLYKLFKQFPSRPFWMNYDLGFQLNAAFWFLGAAGQERLKRDWSIYELDLGSQVEHNVGDTKIGEDVVIDKPNTSVADLLR